MLGELKRRVCDANRRLPALGLAPLNFGNASAVDRARGLVAIKPSGVDYGLLRPSDIVLVDLDGKVAEGRLRPSTDTPTHVELYRAFPAIGGVVHTHSLYGTAFAQAGRAIPVLGTTHADFFDGPIPVTRALRPAELAGHYERDTARAITELFRGRRALPPSVPAALVRHHAPFVWGPSLEKAVENAIALEFCAHAAWLTLGLEANAKAVPDELRRRHFLRKHGAAAYYGQIL